MVVTNQRKSDQTAKLTNPQCPKGLCSLSSSVLDEEAPKIGDWQILVHARYMHRGHDQEKAPAPNQSCAIDLRLFLYMRETVSS